MIWQSNAPYKFRYKVNVNFPNIQLFHYQNTKKSSFFILNPQNNRLHKVKKRPDFIKKSQVFLLVIDYSVFNELQIHVIVRFAVIC